MPPRRNPFLDFAGPTPVSPRASRGKPAVTVSPKDAPRGMDATLTRSPNPFQKEADATLAPAHGPTSAPCSSSAAAPADGAGDAESVPSSAASGKYKPPNPFSSMTSIGDHNGAGGRPFAQNSFTDPEAPQARLVAAASVTNVSRDAAFPSDDPGAADQLQNPSHGRSARTTDRAFGIVQKTEQQQPQLQPQQLQLQPQQPQPQQKTPETPAHRLDTSYLWDEEDEIPMTPISEKASNFFDEVEITAENRVSYSALERATAPTVTGASGGGDRVMNLSGWDRVVAQEPLCTPKPGELLPRDVAGTASHSALLLLQQDIAQLIAERLELQAEVARLRGPQDAESVVRNAMQGEVSATLLANSDAEEGCKSLKA